MEEPQNPFEEPEEPEEEIDEGERELLRQDLIDVETLRDLLGGRGLKGVVFYCPDCGEDHFLGWDLLAGNLRELLQEGRSPVHEPAFDPDPNEYVSWDYARGFLDGYESYEDEEYEEIGVKLHAELLGKGWAAGDVNGLLERIGFPQADKREGTG